MPRACAIPGRQAGLAGAEKVAWAAHLQVDLGQGETVGAGLERLQ